MPNLIIHITANKIKKNEVTLSGTITFANSTVKREIPITSIQQNGTIIISLPITLEIVND